MTFINIHSNAATSGLVLAVITHGVRISSVQTEGSPKPPQHGCVARAGVFDIDSGTTPVVASLRGLVLQIACAHHAVS
jgi:hypothetical protein